MKMRAIAISFLIVGTLVLLILISLHISIIKEESIGENIDKYFQNIIAYCRSEFTKTGECPEDKCKNFGGCPGEDDCYHCVAKGCYDFQKESCPSEFCQIMINCKGESICETKSYGSPPKCGHISYHGQDVACCAGLVKKCVIELKGGACDSNGYFNSYPQCIPCGNKVCDMPFENKCNCPEDCTSVI